MIREEETKDKEKRAIPLHPMLAAVLRRFVPKGAIATDPLISDFPTYQELMADLKEAGIEWRNAVGQRVHYHAMRKTWHNFAVPAGVPERVSQEILGHSDPALTAKAYTDMPAVGMHQRLVKLPWFDDAPLGAPNGRKRCV